MLLAILADGANDRRVSERCLLLLPRYNHVFSTKLLLLFREVQSSRYARTTDSTGQGLQLLDSAFDASGKRCSQPTAGDGPAPVRRPKCFHRGEPGRSAA